MAMANAERQKKWYESHKEKAKISKAEYYLKNKERWHKKYLERKAARLASEQTGSVNLN